MKNVPVWRLALQALEEHDPAMLLYVLDSSGSSPGRRGFFMVVVDAGSLGTLSMKGSIGGGIMEHKFVEMARQLLRSGESAAQTRKQYHDKTAAKDQSGMICSGEQTIFLYRLKQKDKEIIQRIISSLENSQNGTLVLSPSGIGFNDDIPAKNFAFEKQSDDEWEYREKTGFKCRLSIIGGGHCSLSLSNLMRKLDFYIRVYDDRSELNTMLENDAAHEKHVVTDYSELAGLIEPGPDHYVVIMTMGYRTDDIALRALVNKDFAYLGVLGSKSKIEKMMSGYRADGINQERLHQVHAPIGLGIKSESPEEIAVSIAAEIIGVKNVKDKASKKKRTKS